MVGITVHVFSLNKREWWVGDPYITIPSGFPWRETLKMCFLWLVKPPFGESKPKHIQVQFYFQSSGNQEILVPTFWRPGVGLKELKASSI